MWLGERRPVAAALLEGDILLHHTIRPLTATGRLTVALPAGGPR